MKPRVFGFVDHAHSAGAQLSDDAIVGHVATDQVVAALAHSVRGVYQLDSLRRVA